MKKKPLRIIVQLLSLTVFIVLLTTNRLPLWLAIFLVGAILSPLVGRIYCGWICPIYTGTNALTMIKQKLNIKPRRIPKALQAPWIRYVMAGLLIVMFVLGARGPRRFPALLLFLGSGIGLTLFYPEALWHRYLCPYGAILKLTSKRTKNGMLIDEAICQSHHRCKKVCPAEAVETINGQNRIDRSECLVCMKCKMSCPENAIAYTSAEIVKAAD